MHIKFSTLIQKRIALTISAGGIVAITANIITIFVEKEHIEPRIFNIISLSIITGIMLITMIKINKVTKFIQAFSIFAAAELLITLSPIEYSGEIFLVISLLIFFQYFHTNKKYIRISYIVGILGIIVPNIIGIYKLNLAPFSMIRSLLFVGSLYAIILSIIESLRKHYEDQAKREAELNEKNMRIASATMGIIHSMGDISTIKGYNALIQEKINDKDSVLLYLGMEQQIIEEYDEKIKTFLSGVVNSFNSEPEILDVSKLMKQTISFIKAKRLRDKNRDITVNFQSEILPAFIKVKPAEIKTALENIIDNSYDALHKAGKSNKKINITLYCENDNVNLQIKDNGTGFPMEPGVVPHNFFQIGKTSKPNKGHGIGMYIAIKSIQQNSGKIEIINEEEGALFNITFKSAGAAQ